MEGMDAMDGQAMDGMEAMEGASMEDGEDDHEDKPAVFDITKDARKF
jgi:hypothetical protein